MIRCLTLESVKRVIVHRSSLPAAAVLLCLQPGWTALAQNTNDIRAPGGLPISALVAEALEKNPELRFYEAEIAAAQAGRRTAGLLADPEITGEVGHKTSRDGGIRAEGVAWAVSVVQPFEWPGRLGLRKAIANRDLELAELGYARFKVALAARVRSLAFALFAAQEQSAAAEEVADRFGALRAVLLQRDPAGLTPLLETRIIEATELNAQRKAAEAFLKKQSALFELNQLRGVPPQTLIHIETPLLTFRPAPDPELLLQMAHTNNFELRVREVELTRQGFRVELARNERFPTLRVGPSFSEEHAGERERVLGLGVSFPLPLWNRNRGQIETAEARRIQAEVSLQLAEREVQRKVLEATAAYETRLKQMAAWRPDSAAHFREAAEVADRHYRLGAVPISVYVELQKEYLEAVEGLLDTKYEALQAAVALELLAGLSNSLIQTQPW
jgi:cobalt-zinc-cadmium efflux system outer membrane protein